MKNLFKTLAVVVILVLTTVSFTSCDTEPLPEPESMVKDFIGLTTIGNGHYTDSKIYGTDYGTQVVLEFSIGEITIEDCTVLPYNKTLNTRKLTNDSIGYANSNYDITYGNRILVLDGGKYIIRYKKSSDISVLKY